ncbi:MAG: hypothetical protein FJY16_02405 [Bacteroidetes bacterium]|nr:hypothetical protein [Bacteroidota bacterium]
MKTINYFLVSSVIFLFQLLVTQAQIRPAIQKEIRLVNPTPTGTGYVGLRAPEGITTYALSLPSALPTANSLLKVSSVTGTTASMEWQSITGAVTGIAWTLEGNAISAAGTATGQQFLGTTSAQPLVIATTHTTAQPIKLLTGSAERLRINTDGKIGIGTALNASTTLDVGGTFRTSGAANFGSTVEIAGTASLSGTLGVTGEVTLNVLGGAVSTSIQSGFDRLLVANNNGILRQVSLDAVLTHNGYHVTKARGFSTFTTATESVEITPTNGQGNTIGIDTNDAISLTLEGTTNDMAIPSYYISRNTTTGKFMVYFSAPFTGSINWSILE